MMTRHRNGLVHASASSPLDASSLPIGDCPNFSPNPCYTVRFPFVFVPLWTFPHRSARRQTFSLTMMSLRFVQDPAIQISESSTMHFLSHQNILLFSYRDQNLSHVRSHVRLVVEHVVLVNLARGDDASLLSSPLTAESSAIFVRLSNSLDLQFFSMLLFDDCSLQRPICSDRPRNQALLLNFVSEKRFLNLKSKFFETFFSITWCCFVMCGGGVFSSLSLAPERNLFVSENRRIESPLLLYDDKWAVVERIRTYTRQRFYTLTRAHRLTFSVSRKKFIQRRTQSLKMSGVLHIQDEFRSNTKRYGVQLTPSIPPSGKKHKIIVQNGLYGAPVDSLEEIPKRREHQERTSNGQDDICCNQTIGTCGVVPFVSWVYSGKEVQVLSLSHGTDRLAVVSLAEKRSWRSRATYATSIEGGGVMVLSPDEKKVMLVYEYGRYGRCGGAVNPGESTLQAALRERRRKRRLNWTKRLFPYSARHTINLNLEMGVLMIILDSTLSRQRVLTWNPRTRWGNVGGLKSRSSLRRVRNFEMSTSQEQLRPNESIRIKFS